MKTTHPHNRKHPRVSRWQQTAAWTLQSTAVIVFMAAGSSKLLGAERMVAVFDNFFGGDRLRHLVGGLQIVGAMLLLFPDRAYVGGLILSALMASAVFAHFLLLEGSPIPALALLCITIAIVWLRRPMEDQSSPWT